MMTQEMTQEMLHRLKKREFECSRPESACSSCGTAARPLYCNHRFGPIMMGTHFAICIPCIEGHVALYALKVMVQG
jgi:hypothetical protein